MRNIFFPHYLSGEPCVHEQRCVGCLQEEACVIASCNSCAACAQHYYLVVAVVHVVYCLQGVAVAAKSDKLYKNKKGVTEATPFCASRWA